MPGAMCLLSGGGQGNSQFGVSIRGSPKGSPYTWPGEISWCQQRAWSSVLGGPFCPLGSSPPSWLSPLPSVGTLCPSGPLHLGGGGEKARPVGEAPSGFDGWATTWYSLSTKESLRLLAEHSTFWGHLHSLGHPSAFCTSLVLGGLSVLWGLLHWGGVYVHETEGEVNKMDNWRRLLWVRVPSSLLGTFPGPPPPSQTTLCSLVSFSLTGPILWGLFIPLQTPIHPLDQVFCPPRPSSALQCLLCPLGPPPHSRTPCGACFQGPSSLQAECSVIWWPHFQPLGSPLLSSFLPLQSPHPLQAPSPLREPSALWARASTHQDTPLSSSPLLLLGPPPSSRAPSSFQAFLGLLD